MSQQFNNDIEARAFALDLAANAIPYETDRADILPLARTFYHFLTTSDAEPSRASGEWHSGPLGAHAAANQDACCDAEASNTDIAAALLGIVDNLFGEVKVEKLLKRVLKDVTKDIFG